MTDALLVLTQCPDDATAERMARALVESQAAACVTRLAPAASIYRWQGAVETAAEIPLLIKCTRATYADVERQICELHPHQVPEVIALPVAAGFAPYLRWLADETQPPLLA